MTTKRIGELLLEAKRAVGGPRAGAPSGEAGPSLTPALIEQALEAQRKEGGRLGEILIKMRAVTEEDEIDQIRIQQATDESGPLEPSMMPKPAAPDQKAPPKGNQEGPTAPGPPPPDHNPPVPPPVEAPPPTTTPPPSGAP